MKEESVHFTVGGLSLSGVVHVPDKKMEEETPAIVLVHGFVGSKVGEHRMFVKAARKFTDEGFTVFRFDFSGCGDSEGDYGEITLTRKIREVKGALDYVSNLPFVDEMDITVIGHSLGGAVSSLTAAEDERVSRLILWSPVADPYKDIVSIVGKEAEIIAEKEGAYDYDGFYLKPPFFQSLTSFDPLKAVKRFEKNVLLIHAEEDEDVPKENTAKYASALQERQKGTVEWFYIAGADHTFSSYCFEKELFETSLIWMQQKATIQI
ncbi:alpha/beta hydrolase [Thalassorhabdus alkalitolerans]|uniref:Alpha/beta hydrolase n=1 Tax=Thalassorhabdus alkalitolerans TaxID=2282697 RepID=A0ABW0YQ01_9BACI